MIWVTMSKSLNVLCLNVLVSEWGWLTVPASHDCCEDWWCKHTVSAISMLAIPLAIQPPACFTPWPASRLYSSTPTRCPIWSPGIPGPACTLLWVTSMALYCLQGTPGSLLLCPLKISHHAQPGIQGLSQSGLALPFHTHFLLYPQLPIY